MKLKAMLLTASIFVMGASCVATAATTLRILDYNIRNGIGMDGKRDIERTAAFIKAQHPDLVALQEVDNNARRSGRMDLAKRLGDLTGMIPVFGKAMDFQGGAYGDAVLTRYPPQKIVIHQLPGTKGHEPREMMEIHIAIGTNGPAIVFYNTHLDDQSTAERLAQVKAINEIVSASPSTNAIQILAGDFNCEPTSEPMLELQKLWQDAGPAATQLTYPADKPASRIDHVYYRSTPKLRVLEAKVLDEPLISDHRPILVTVEIAADNPSK